MSLAAGIQDLYTSLNKSQGAKEQPPEKIQEALPWDLILYKEIQDSTTRDKVNRLILNMPVELKSGSIVQNKDVTGVDLGPVRIVSLYPYIAQIVNLETKFLNLLKKKPSFPATDYQIRIPEENINGDQVSAFNVESTLPGVQQSVLSERSNTLMAFGQELQISFMAEELAAQSPYRRNEIQAQIQKALIRMDRTLNPLLLNSVEQTSEAIPNIPAMGGFVTRSTNGVVNVGGGNLTDALISNAITTMAGFFGYDQLTDIVGFTNNTQISVIRNLMINRYPGNQPMAKLQYDEVLVRRLQTMGLEPSEIQMIYEDNNTLTIPFVRDTQLPAGTTVLFRSSLPQMASFKMGGKEGSFLVERPVTNLYHLSVLFDLKSLVDPLVVSRILLTNHA